MHLVYRQVLALTFSGNRRSISDVFRIQVISNPDVRSPIITLGSTSFFHARENNVYVVGVTKCVHGSASSPSLMHWLLQM